MLIQFSYNETTYQVDLDQGLDLSIPLAHGDRQVNCFWAPPFEISPVRTDQFIGSIEEGGLVNFKNVRINPHGNVSSILEPDSPSLRTMPHTP